MSDNNKPIPLHSWSLGELKIVEWEKYAKTGNKYLQYSISKTEYEKPKSQGYKGTYKSIFSLTLNRKEDIVVIKYLLKNKLKEKQDFGSYSFFKEKNNDPSNNRYVLTKTYEDYDTHVTKEQTAIVVPYEILLLEELIDKFIKDVAINCYSNNQSSNSNYNSSFSDTSSSDDYEQGDGNNSNSGNSGNNGNNKNNNSDNDFVDRVLDDNIPF